MPIYIVQDRRQNPNAENQPRLIDAISKAQAITFITKDLYEARPATTKEVAALMGKGVKVEEAGGGWD